MLDDHTSAVILGLVCKVLFEKYNMTPREVSDLFCRKHTEHAKLVLEDKEKSCEPERRDSCVPS